jgi:hypothetical protein
VAKYLKAFEDGTIDSLYGSNEMGYHFLFCLDDSGSMSGQPWADLMVAYNSFLQKRKATGAKDLISVLLHDDTARLVVDQVPLVNAPTSLTPRLQGNSFYVALIEAQRHLRSSRAGFVPMIIFMSDGGDCDPHKNGARNPVLLMEKIYQEHKESGFVCYTLGYGQGVDYEILKKLAAAGRGSTIQAPTAVDLKGAFDRLTVSEKIEKKAENISTSECCRLLSKYTSRCAESSRLKQAYWIKYLYRRCGILASSEKFNKNKDFPQFGSSTMKIMLDEVEHALSEKLDWDADNHEQLVYCKESVQQKDGTSIPDYKWSILASNPDSSDAGWNARLGLLRSLQMTVPTSADLARSDRRILDSYLANGLGIKLQNMKPEVSSAGCSFDFELGSLPLIDESKFVLTLELMMKMLCMHERIECRVPCIMEGETGVCKTALARMLFSLKNTNKNCLSTLEEVCKEGREASLSRRQDAIELSVLWKLIEYWTTENEDNLEENQELWHDFYKLSNEICQRIPSRIQEDLFAEIKSNPGLDPLAVVDPQDFGATLESAALLRWYVRDQSKDKSHPMSWTFYPVDVHAALTPKQIADDPVFGVNQVVKRAKRIKQLGELLDSQNHRDATLCIFFDEVNTSSCMGVFKELIIDHSLNGVPLPDNIVIVAACNPAREKIELAGDRREELGQEWVIGHYQVHPLPESMQELSWNFGSLKPKQEKEFIEKSLHFLKKENTYLSQNQADVCVNLIYNSQQITR